jgi:ATP-dependent protease ClpP protease subunit
MSEPPGLEAGDVFEGNAILNVIARWAGKKIVHIDGLAASMASV